MDLSHLGLELCVCDNEVAALQSDYYTLLRSTVSIRGLASSDVYQHTHTHIN